MQISDKTPPRPTRVFLSYSRKDVVFAENLQRSLKAEGYDVLLDATDIAAGEDWQARLGRLIVEADTVVFCLSPHSVASKICSWEAGEAERLGKRILPVVVKAVPDASVPPGLSKLNFIFFHRKPHEAALATLRAAIDADLPWLREHTRLGDLALQWQGKPGNAGILRGGALESAERWIASQPRNAALATDLHRDFIATSRKATGTRQRNWISGAAAVVVLSLGLAGWSEVNRREAVKQTAIADQQRLLADAQREEAVEQKNRAEKVLAAATATASGLVFELAQKMRDIEGVPVDIIRGMLEKAQGLQTQLSAAGEPTPALLYSQAAAQTELAITLLSQGETAPAMEAARQAVLAMERLVALTPGDSESQRGLAAVHTQIGDVLQARGDLESALSSYSNSLTIAKNLVAKAAGNPEWLRDLAVAHSKVGEIQQLQAKTDAALSSYRASFAALEKLATQDPANPEWQRDLVVGHLKIGDILQLQGKRTDALQSYSAGIATAEKLVASQPANTKWQRDLAGNYIRIGDVQALQGDLASARASFQKCLTITASLARQDPGNTEWQRNLSVSHIKIGEVQQAQGAMADALTSFRASINIAAKLAAQDPGNAVWQRDLSVSHVLLANAGDDPKGNFQKALLILETMKTKGILPTGDEHFMQQIKDTLAALK